jgi:hypothetical protein
MILSFFLGAFLAASFYGFLVITHGKWFKCSFIGDTSWHFLVTKRIKENNRYDGIPELLMRDGPDTYPRFYHWICSFFPLQLLKEKQYIPNFVLSVFLYGILYSYLFHIADFLNINDYGFFILLFSLFLFTQIHQVVLKGDKILNIQLSERLMAGLCSAFYYLSLYFFYTFHDYTSLIISCLFAGICWVVSMFSRQVILFSSLILSLLTLSFVPICIAAISYCLAMVFDFKYLNSGMVQQIEFLNSYCKFFKYGTIMKNNVLGKGYPNLKELRSKKTVGSFLYAIYSRPPFILFLENPDILFLSGYIYYEGLAWNQLSFFLAPIILYALTTSKALHFLGEPERYVHYLLKFYSPFLFVILVNKSTNTIIPILIPLFYAAIYFFKEYSSMKKHVPEIDEISNILDTVDVPKQSVFYCVPHTLGSAVVLRKGCKALTHQGARYPLNYMKTIVLDPPFLRHDWGEIFQDYSITHILVNKRTDAMIRESCSWSYNYDGLEKLSENQSYILYSSGYLKNI